MTKLLDEAMEVVRRLPSDDQDDIARAIMPLAGSDLPAPVVLSPEERELRRNTAHEVYCSAATGIGLDALLERIDEMIAIYPLSRVRLRVPQADGKVLALLDARARVLSRRYRNGFVEMEAQAPESVLREVQKFVRD